ncbi:MFS transporter [Cellulomonas sp. JZ18]|nr:MFS transporter [Cellulomonas sp. JZ18]
MRGPITALAPVVDLVSGDLALTPAAAGLLTGVPVLCFAAVTPLAAVALSRAGTTRMLAAALLAILAGTLLRSFGGTAGAFAGTVVLGAAITVCNVGVPLVIGRDFPTRVPRVMGLYSAVMNGGAALTTLGTAPLAALVGWRWALAAWGLLVVVALAVWTRVHLRASAPAAREPRVPVADEAVPDASVPVTAASAPVPSVLRRPVTWLLVVAFAGQSAGYMGLTAWLPSVLRDEAGLTRAGAGVGAALFQVLGVVGSLVVPPLLARERVAPRAVVVTIAACWLSLPLGLLLAPAGWAAWSTLAGLAQAANFVVVFTVVATVAGSPAAARRMSATVQTVGYSVAAVTPSALGAVHDATGGWAAPLLVVAGLLTMMAVAHTTAVGALRRG